MQKSIQLEGYIVGPEGVGKKTMIHLLAPEGILIINNSGQTISINFTINSEDLLSNRQLELKNMSLILFVFDCTRMETFKELQKNYIDKVFQKIKRQNHTFILVQNKCDLLDMDTSDDKRIKNYSVMMGFSLCQFSCVLNSELENLKQMIQKNIEKIDTTSTITKKKHGSLNLSIPPVQSFEVELSDHDEENENDIQVRPIKSLQKNNKITHSMHQLNVLNIQKTEPDPPIVTEQKPKFKAPSFTKNVQADESKIESTEEIKGSEIKIDSEIMMKENSNHLSKGKKKVKYLKQSKLVTNKQPNITTESNEENKEEHKEEEFQDDQEKANFEMKKMDSLEIRESKKSVGIKNSNQFNKQETFQMQSPYFDQDKESEEEQEQEVIFDEDIEVNEEDMQIVQKYNKMFAQPIKEFKKLAFEKHKKLENKNAFQQLNIVNQINYSGSMVCFKKFDNFNEDLLGVSEVPLKDIKESESEQAPSNILPEKISSQVNDPEVQKIEDPNKLNGIERMMSYYDYMEQIWQRQKLAEQLAAQSQIQATLIQQQVKEQMRNIEKMPIRTEQVVEEQKIQRQGIRVINRKSQSQMNLRGNPDVRKDISELSILQNLSNNSSSINIYSQFQIQ